MPNGIPPIKTITNILFNNDECIEWLISSKIIWLIRKCPICNKDMLLNKNLKRYRHCCNNSKKKEIAMFKNTFFSNVKIFPCELMTIIYFWLQGANFTFVKNVTGHSKQVITNIFKDLNDLAALNVNEEKLKIGGPNIIVEIDESKLAKRKYNRAHRVEGVWVVGGIEKTNEKNIFFVEVQNRNAATLQEIIENYVLSGSIICTDCWAGYNFLDNNLNYIYEKVNYSLGFKDPITNVHTNTIEGT